MVRNPKGADRLWLETKVWTFRSKRRRQTKTFFVLPENPMSTRPNHQLLGAARASFTKMFLQIGRHSQTAARAQRVITQGLETHNVGRPAKEKSINLLKSSFVDTRMKRNTSPDLQSASLNTSVSFLVLKNQITQGFHLNRVRCYPTHIEKSMAAAI